MTPEYVKAEVVTQQNCKLILMLVARILDRVGRMGGEGLCAINSAVRVVVKLYIWGCCCPCLGQMCGAQTCAEWHICECAYELKARLLVEMVFNLLIPAGNRWVHDPC